MPHADSTVLTGGPLLSGDAFSASPQIFSIALFLRTLLQNRQLIRNVWISVLALTVIYVALRKPTYAATASLMPPDNSTNSSGIMGLLSSSAGGSAISASGLLPGLRQSGEFFVGVLQSRTAQQALVDQFHLQAYYHAKNAEDACRSLSKKSSFNDNLKSGIVSITVQDHDPKMAAALANAYAGELDHLLTHNSTSAAGRERVFLEKRLRQVKADLDVSSKALSTYASKNRTIDIPSQAKLMMEAGMHLNLELASTRAELVALRQTYSSDNARVRAAEARMAELQRQVGQINGSINSGNKEAEASGYPAISALPTLALGFTDLQRRAAVDEALWSALTKQYEAARVQEAKEIPTVRLLDPAEVPTQKSTADRAVVLLMGAVLGLFVGIFAAVMRTCWQGVAREKKELMFALLPFAGAR